MNQHVLGTNAVSFPSLERRGVVLALPGLPPVMSVQAAMTAREFAAFYAALPSISERRVDLRSASQVVSSWASAHTQLAQKRPASSIVRAVG